tara:strand:- start:282 stop:503 length:222 start_codon:yes stop_codon:yes gene_type:complete
MQSRFHTQPTYNITYPIHQEIRHSLFGGRWGMRLDRDRSTELNVAISGPLETFDSLISFRIRAILRQLGKNRT